MTFRELWYISYQVAGRKYVEAVSSNRKFTEDALGKIKADIREGRFFNKIPETPWYKAVEQFKGWIQNNVKPSTRVMYETCLANLKPHFERYTLNQITPHMVEKYKAERAGKVTNSTVNRDLATLKRLFSLSLKWGLVEGEKMRGVSLLKENPARTRFLSEEEIGRLMKAIGESRSQYLKLAVLISLDTGLRRSSVFSLKWSEIDFETGFIRKITKGDKEVKVPLTDRLKKTLLAHKGRRKILSKYVLGDLHGNPVKSLKTAFTTALVTAKITGLRWHDLRRTFGSHFIAATKDLVALQEILGHSDFNITKKHYAHLIDEHLRTEMDAFERKVQI